MRHTNLRQRGLSLVELMVAMTLGLLLVLVAIGILLSSSQGFNAVDHGSAARDKQRLATELLTSVILQAGYEDWGNPRSILQSASRLENPAIDFEPEVFGWDNALYAVPADQNLSTSNSIANGDRPGKCGSDDTTACLNGSDILVIRFQGMSAASDATTGDRSMLNCSGGTEPAPLNDMIEERAINVFHLSKNSSSGEASLSCAVYRDGWSQSAPLIEGIESFQVLYGTDAVEPGLATSPNVADSVADRWLRADQITVAGNAAASGTYRDSTVGLLGGPMLLNLGQPVVSESSTAGRRTATYNIGVMTAGANGVDTGSDTASRQLTLQVGRMSWRQVHNHRDLRP